MALFMDIWSEIMALMVVFLVAAPAIFLMCCILDECPVGSKTSFEEIPVFCGAAPADVFGSGLASLACFFFIAVTVFGCAAFAGGFYMTWRGQVQMGGADINESTSGLFGLVQLRHQKFNHFNEGGGNIAKQLQHPEQNPTTALLLTRVKARRGSGRTSVYLPQQMRDQRKGQEKGPDKEQEQRVKPSSSTVSASSHTTQVPRQATFRGKDTSPPAKGRLPMSKEPSVMELAAHVPALAA